MKRSLLTAAPLTVAAVLGTLPAGNAYGQFAPRGGHTEIPDSSIEQPQHIGVRAHTNHKMFMPAAGEMAKALPLQASPRWARPIRGISSKPRLRLAACISSSRRLHRGAIPTTSPPIPLAAAKPSPLWMPTIILQRRPICSPFPHSLGCGSQAFRSSTPTVSGRRLTPIGTSRRRSTSHGRMHVARSKDLSGRGRLEQLC